MIELLKNKNREIKTSAIEALGKIGPKAYMALPELRKILLDQPYGWVILIKTIQKIRGH